jgi:SAM-dependent methyltransferase
VQRLLPDPAARILDLGCGSGALLERLLLMGYGDLVGIYISPPASTGGIHYQQADLDIFQLDRPDASFDLVLAVEVIEHIENLGLFCQELARLLKPGGLALFTTPNLHSAQAKILFALTDRLKQFDAKGDPTHITPIVLFPFTRLLHRYGLAVQDCWSFPLDGRSPTSRPAMRLAARLFSLLLPASAAHGDTLCLLIERDNGSLHPPRDKALDKAAALTAHYS